MTICEDSSKRFTLRQHGLKGKLGGALLLTVLSAALIVAPPFTPGAWAQDTEGDIRLADGKQAHEGRVEIYHDGEWGSVCNDIWDETAHSDPRDSTESRVVCRQLGYAGGGVSSLDFGRGDGPIWLDEVACTGYEDRLEDCHRIVVGASTIAGPVKISASFAALLPRARGCL